MSRADLEGWLSKRLGDGLEPTKLEKPRVFASVQVPTTFSDEKEAKLEEALRQLQEEFGFELVQPRDPEQEALNRVMRQIDDHIRKGARMHIRELKKSRLSLGRKLTAAERKRLWNFSDDELAIPRDATWEQVQAVLDYVGSGDQFERLRDEAMRLFDVPEKFVREHPHVDHDEAARQLQRVMEDRGVLWARSEPKFTPSSFEGFK